MEKKWIWMLVVCFFHFWNEHKMRNQKTCRYPFCQFVCRHTCVQDIFVCCNSNSISLHGKNDNASVHAVKATKTWFAEVRVLELNHRNKTHGRWTGALTAPQASSPNINGWPKQKSYFKWKLWLWHCCCQT